MSEPEYTKSQMSSVYETMKLYWNKAWGVNALSRHSRRMYQALRALEVDLEKSLDEFSLHFLEVIRQVVAKEKLEKSKQYRLRVHCDLESFDLSADIQLYEMVSASSVSVGTFQGRRFKPEIKSQPADVSIQARAQAVCNQHYENLLVDSEGVLREGAWTNFFWLSEDGIWRTPATSILPGITRELALTTNEKILEVDSTLKDVQKELQCMVISNALISFLAVSSFEEQELETEKAKSFCLEYNQKVSQYFESIEY